MDTQQSIPNEIHVPSEGSSDLVARRHRLAEHLSIAPGAISKILSFKNTHPWMRFIQTKLVWTEVVYF